MDQAMSPERETAHKVAHRHRTVGTQAHHSRVLHEVKSITHIDGQYAREQDDHATRRTDGQRMNEQHTGEQDDHVTHIRDGEHHAGEQNIREEQIRAVKSNRLLDEQANEIASLFSILKDPTRLQVLYTLLNAPPQGLCVSEIAQGLERDDTTISHQLRLLLTRRVVAMRKEGRVIYYRLIDDHIRVLLELAQTHTTEFQI